MASKRFATLLDYGDDLFDVVVAVLAYRDTKDESDFAEALTQIALNIVREHAGADPSKQVDEERLRKAVVEIVAAIEPVFG